ncbi:unnamed protein product [Phytophthora fragariaefolia]|uniref:Unnamed protein product n=1 Tax=Phytophthora fragariaefolia TaxID=1490495 RepID=A0A9W6X8Q5_9STRA|nr:unnamed protein product [Phytophthora fragariaefolia]
MDLESENGEVDFIQQITAILNEYQSHAAILLATVSPLFAVSRAAHGVATRSDRNIDDISMDSAQQWRIVQGIVGWNLSDLKRQIVLLSFDDKESWQTLVTIKNTTLSLTQLVCGPLVGVPNSIGAHFNEPVRPQTNPIEQLVVRHGAPDRRPQYIEMFSLGYSREASMSGRRASGADAPYVNFQAQLMPVQELRNIRRVVGPVVGCVSSRVARILIECDSEGEIACVAVDRLTLEEHRVVQRVKAYRPAIFSMTELTPGRSYNLSFQGLLNEEDGIVQTQHENLPAFRIIVVSEDRFLSETTKDVFSRFSPSYLGNVSSHFLPVVGKFQANVTVHLGCIAALTHDLRGKYRLLAQGQQRLPAATVMDSVRQCVRQHWNTPKTQQFLARGGHWFPSIGVLRELLTQQDIPILFLTMVRRALAEYEQVGDFRSHSNLPSEKYLYSLQGGVAVLMIDTTELILHNAELTPFVQSFEALLSVQQWKALEFWLQADQIGFTKDDEGNQDIAYNTLVIMCDLPLISQQEERQEMARMWDQHYKVEFGSAKAHRRAKVSDIIATSWSLYPKEQARLLHLIFRKLKRNSAFHVVFICSGSYASRTRIRENASQLSFDQIIVGSISKLTSSRLGQAAVTSPAFADKNLAESYSIEQEVPAGAINSQQYCALDLVPHPFGASSDVKFYVQNQGEARLILGPVIGRVTPRTARILVELDRPVQNLVCTLVDPGTSHRYTSRANVDALTPTILKIEGLQPGTRYAIEFESNTQSNTQWPRILANGMTSFSAQLAGHTSHYNGDYLGDHDDEKQQNFNPWYSIEEEYLSEPLSNPQLLVHLGGQVDMSRAFTDDELIGIVVRLVSCVESGGYDDDSEPFRLLRTELRYRMQEVYRVFWGVPPMKHLLGYCSNIMLLNEGSDLYFNQSNLRRLLSTNRNISVSDAALNVVVSILRGISFELWQLYQNQLWADLVERELKYGSKSSGNKSAFSNIFGINCMVIANVTHDAYEYCRVVEAENNVSAAPVTRATEEPSSIPSINLFSAASWKVIDEAMENSGAVLDAAQIRAAPTRPKNPVQQLVMIIAGDLMAWGGSKTFPALRSEIVKLFEKLFAWKFVDRIRREVAVICCRTKGSSITFEVTDEKIGENITLTCIGSISEARELLHRDLKKTKGAVPVTAKGAAISKGHFSKRFSYRSVTSTNPAASGSNSVVVGEEKHSPAKTDEINRAPARCRTFASYRFITDYRRGFYDETLRFFPPQVSLPKAILGPVIGRMVLNEAPKPETEEPLADGDPGNPVKLQFSVPILLEVNADARVVCVVTDILANQDVRVVQTLTRYHPHVFKISSLLPERRYVYHFEGIANSESRRGSFHTPPSSSEALNFLAVSSNFPEQMEETSDSLWAAISNRVQVSWCGLDMILHLGGQVPMHEAAFECFEWVNRKLKSRGNNAASADDTVTPFLRRKVRQRLQQRYRLCWNVPNVRETLAHTSNWFLRSQADVAPFFRNHEVPNTKAAQLVLSEAQQIVADYQLALMQQDTSTMTVATSEVLTPSLDVTLEEPHDVVLEKNQDSDARSGETKELESANGAPVGKIEGFKLNQDHKKDESGDDNINERIDTAQFIQTGEVGIFMCDMRSTPHDEVVTCNNRLLTPLTQQEQAVISEKQWMQLEKAMKKKSVMVLVLCMELPLILTDAKYADVMREEARFAGVDIDQDEPSGRWKFYDRQNVAQHWVSCRRQLEQLLNLLFRWKAKHRGRDVLVLSGGMRVGLETVLQDRDTKLSVRNLTVGPLTARVESDFSNMPLSGTACPTFLGGAQRDERFTFTHSVVSSKNYVLAHAIITREQSNQQGGAGEPGAEIRSANIETEFIADDTRVDAAHPVNRFRRFPAWWTNYVPMGKAVFWDDTVTMRAHSDDDVMSLSRYLREGREFTAALEVLFEKHQFAEAARMEELRSKHRRRQRGPEELRASLRAVFAELWKVLPDSHRQRVAYFRDDFVFDCLLGYLAPHLFESAAQDEEERPPLEFNAFSMLCREFIFNAGVLNLSLSMQQEDARRAIALQRAEARRQAAEREAQRVEQEQRRAEEEAELARLQREDPEQYAKRKLAEQEAAQQEKLAKAEAAREQRKAEKMRDVEEELAIAKEQRKLDKLAESSNDPLEFNRRRELLAARIRKFEERKRLREADEARRREKKEKKKRENAAQQKEAS